ncbi:cleavage and polyadenylation specifity factor protein [Besnoitia besnoiti]|uniref:Cleavage and polyadenylation specifity factor protein n=1 Tax=Besnoitia besnoiti TaxID=94643 RepID=A0A2A9MA02_BESBE|nr:cleavage and polyadenylation specifity factor protein [Besnoitia besnoiti]PFH34815.1 cleavage and polyadenylation specifity factor protein [Besnoitia besnoiti]
MYPSSSAADGGPLLADCAGQNPRSCGEGEALAAAPAPPPSSASSSSSSSSFAPCFALPGALPDPATLPPMLPLSPSPPLATSASSAATVHIDASAKRRRLLLGEDWVEITPLGAGCEVGRSCVVVRYKGLTVMFDCGVHPAYSGLGALPIFDAIDMTSVDVCLVTHFHLDHCGALPYLVTKTAFRGRVFMTEPTRVISKLLWLDYARMSAFATTACPRTAAVAPLGGDGGEKGAGNYLYDEDDVDATVQMIECLDFHQEVEVGGIKISCFGAGHVLGACMFLIEIGGVRMLYTGDFSREKDRHVPVAEVPPVDVQLLICESTYGIHVHDDRQLRERRFIKAVLDIVLTRGGKCLLPVFALGRAQELLLILDEYWIAHPEVRHVPILFLSPLSSKCMIVFDAFIDMCGDAVRNRALRGENPFAFRFVKNLKTFESARVYVHHEGPAVIMAAPGMLQSGASREIFEALAPDAKNGVILTGYSVKGTLADELKREPETIQLPDRVLRRRCSFEVISFSAHSDYQQTQDFIGKLKVPNVVLVHGERGEMRRLKEKLEEERPALCVFTPEILQKVSLQFTPSRCVVAAGKLGDDVQRLLIPAADSDLPQHAAAGDAAHSRGAEAPDGGDAAPRAADADAPGAAGAAEALRPARSGDGGVSADVEGVLVVQEGQPPLLLYPEDLPTSGKIAVTRLRQKLRLPFVRPLGALRQALQQIYEEVEDAPADATWADAEDGAEGGGARRSQESRALQDAETSRLEAKGASAGAGGKETLPAETNGERDVAFDATRADGSFVVGRAVRVSRHPRKREEIVVEWLTSPTADLIADSVSFLAIDLMRDGSGLTAEEMVFSSREAQSEGAIADVLIAQLQRHFGAVEALPQLEADRASAAGHASRVKTEVEDLACASAAKQRDDDRLREALAAGDVLLRFFVRNPAAAASAPGAAEDARPREEEKSAAERDSKKMQDAGDDQQIPVEIDMASRTVRCKNPEIQQKVYAMVRRIESALLPLPLS